MNCVLLGGSTLTSASQCPAMVRSPCPLYDPGASGPSGLSCTLCTPISMSSMSVAISTAAPSTALPCASRTVTVNVLVRDAQGKAVDGAAVLIATDMLDMDMGVQSVQLKPLGPDAPGSYSGQGDLTMAGHWDALVKVLPPKSTQFIQADFRFSASY